MSRNNGTDESGPNVVRLFVWTAVVAVVLSLGVIIGQHMLTQQSVPPAVSTAAEPPDLSTGEQEPGEGDEPADEQSSDSDLYSFYDALTGDQAREADEARTAEDPDPETVEGRAAEAEIVAEGDEDLDQPDDETPPARYTLQVASYPTMERARIEMDRLEALDLDPQLVTEQTSDGDELYQVRIGEFPTEEKARAHRNRLENNHDVRPLITSL